MYPNLYLALKDLFGDHLPSVFNFLRFVNSFGFFVALSFVGAAVTLTMELKRKEREGLLYCQYQLVMIGKPASPGQLLMNFLIGFLFGYKFLGLFFSDSSLTVNPQEYIGSSAGSWPAGLLMGAFFAGWKWYESNKQKLAVPEERKIRIWPHDRIGDLTMFAAIFGFAGAKVFNSLETWDDFVKNPIDSLFSFSGLTFYGGLICAAVAIWIYARKHGIGFWYLNDAAAPGLMLAYAVGRIGCQVAGDGDWGILNSAYVTRTDGKSVLAQTGDFQRVFAQNKDMFLAQLRNIHSTDTIPQHLAVKAPGWLPDWFFAYAYPHNVVGEGVRIPVCEGSYCSQLPIPVFPTPLYETIVCLGLFFLLWTLRKKIDIPGRLFAIYLMVNGVERFFVEKIRVNTKYDFLPFHPTQAEIISFSLVLSGAVLFFTLKKQPPPAPLTADADPCMAPEPISGRTL